VPGWPKSQAVIALGLSDQTLPRYPTVYPPPLSTKLVHAFRTIARIGHQLLRTHLPQIIRQSQQFDDAPIGLSQVSFRTLVANNKEVFASRPATEA
jgi:hypothetical protein